MSAHPIKSVSPTELHKDILAGSPITPIVRVNKLGLILVIVVLASVFIIGFSSIPNNPTSANVETDQTQSEDTTSLDHDWIKNQSNAVPGRREKKELKNVASQVEMQEDSSVPDLSQPASALEGQGEKRRQRDLIAALNSPISAPGMDSQVMGETSNSQSSTSINTDLTQKLPLTDEEAVRITHALETGALTDENQQSKKQLFLKNTAQTSDQDNLHEDLKIPLSPYEVQAGTLIPASLIGGINSDLPGQSTAQVNENIYDSQTGKHLLIPQGSKLNLVYDSQITYGQKRVLVVVKRIIFPNGSSMNLEGMPGVDVSGLSGFKDQVDNHYVKIFGSAAMLGTISAGFQLSQPQQNNGNSYPSTTQVFAGAMGQQMSQVSSSMMNKNLDIQPSLEIRPGYKFNVQVTQDMIFTKPYEN